MANELLTPQVIAREAIITLYENLVMANLMHRDYETEFAAKIGDTVTIRKPTTFEARQFDPATGIEIQHAVEDSTDVTLDQHFDVSFEVGSKELTLDIRDFGMQFLDPAMEAHAQNVDRACLSLRDDVPEMVGTAAENPLGEDFKGYRGNFPWSDSRVLNQAGVVLTKNNVPLTGRSVVTGPETAGLWTTENVWRHADKRGSTEGLHEARIGARAAGFDPYMTQNVRGPEQGADGTEVGVAFHRTAFALVSRPLALPMGSRNAEIIAYKGLSIRVVYDYDSRFKKDIISLDMLYGVKTLSPERAVLIGNPAYTGEDEGGGEG